MLVSFKAIGRNIRAARTALDITQEEAADRLKISQLHFGRLERGERPISLEMLAQIASVLDVSLSAQRLHDRGGFFPAPEPRFGIARPERRRNRQRLLVRVPAADARALPRRGTER